MLLFRLPRTTRTKRHGADRSRRIDGVDRGAQGIGAHRSRDWVARRPRATDSAATRRRSLRRGSASRRRARAVPSRRGRCRSWSRQRSRRRERDAAAWRARATGGTHGGGGHRLGARDRSALRARCVSDGEAAEQLYSRGDRPAEPTQLARSSPAPISLYGEWLAPGGPTHATRANSSVRPTSCSPRSAWRPLPTGLAVSCYYWVRRSEESAPTKHVTNSRLRRHQIARLARRRA